MKICYKSIKGSIFHYMHTKRDQFIPRIYSICLYRRSSSILFKQTNHDPCQRFILGVVVSSPSRQHTVDPLSQLIDKSSENQYILIRRRLDERQKLNGVERHWIFSANGEVELNPRCLYGISKWFPWKKIACNRI